MELLKLLDLTEIVVQLASFLILLVLLRVFAWKRILNILQQRRERIAGEFSSIEKAKLEVAHLKDTYETQLGEIEKKAKERIDKAIEEGRKVSDDMRKLAHIQAQDIITDARKNIEYELKKAQDEVKDKIVDLAIAAAETVIREKFTEKDDKIIVEDFLKNIDMADDQR
ncbi:MAG: F0F1 ATP synthase subunit B [Candidatus Omnitrophota bacterium]|nr:F0F1 ATP synthase subunit B [Candidatus Omnitrophota bacterium]